MEPENLPKQMLNWRPSGRKDIGRPRIRWSCSSEQFERPNPLTQMMMMTSC